MQYLKHNRIVWLAIALLVAMAIFVLRLFQLQIIQHGTYTELARASQQRQFVIPAQRGEIYMMDGSSVAPVVLNQTVYTVIADPQAVDKDKRDEIVASLREIAGGETVDDVRERLDNTKSRYEVLARNITKTQAEKLKKKNFAGVLYQQGSIRSYPEGGLGAQVLGFVNAEGKGQYGIEGGLDKRLKGSDGLLQSVTDVRNVPLAVGKNNVRVEAKPGENVVLTIDRNIQSQAEEILQRQVQKIGATQGNILVMNPNNGQVMAMANYPTYAPDDYAKQKDASVFVNGTTMTPYEPGSIVKTFTMATGIDNGVISPQSTYNNTDCTEVGDRKICNALRGQVGTLTMQQAFNNSYNVGTVTIGRMLGDGSYINGAARQTIYDYFHNRFGFGSATNIEVSEVAGIVKEPNTGDGDEVRYANMTFGQGLDVTSVQLAAAFCSVVNGGQYYRPTLVAGTMNDGTFRPVSTQPLRRTISQETSQSMRQMLDTARHSFWVGSGDRAGYTIGGKTGTSELLVNGAYTLKETAATYIGFGGADKPEYVIMVYVSAPGKGIALEGGTHASPIFAEMSNWMIDYMKIAPKG